MTMADREAGLRDAAGKSLLYSDEPYSCTVPACSTERLVSRNATRPGRSRHIPTPKSLRVLGGPSKAENMTVIRPFSRTCEMVSTPATVLRVSASGSAAHMGYTLPLPVRSSYQTCFELTMWKQSAVPLADRLMWPCALSGAVATQNVCCFLIHSKYD